MFVDQEPLSGPITLYEAMARAIKYNLDHRMKALEEAVALKQVDVAKFNLLPRVIANAGYSTRSRQNASVSRSIETQTQSLEASTSQDRDIWRLDGTVTWNMLDFGVSYFEARQNGDRAHVARERTRKVVHNLIQTVRFAFWRAAAAQMVEGTIGPILDRAERALDDSRTIERENLQPVLDTLEYQKTLIEIVRRLEGLRDRLQQAHYELANLMNLEPGLDFTLDVPDTLYAPLEMSGVSVTDLENLALAWRPELYEADYQERITANEVHRVMIRLFPGLQLTASRQYDSNSFAVHQSWIEAAAKFSLNLIEIAGGPTSIDLARTAVDVAKSERFALSMAILSQVRLAHQQYVSLLQQYARSSTLSDINERIAEHTKTARRGSAASEVEEIRVIVVSIFSQLGQYETYALLQNALGRVYASIGLDPLTATVEKDDVATVAAAIKSQFNRWSTEGVSMGLAPGEPSADGAQEADPDALEDLPTGSDAVDGVLLWFESLFD